MNTLREEISSRSYLEAIVAILRNSHGVMEASELEEHLADHFHNEFGPADLKPMKGRKRLKWQNAVDWAKATGCARGILRTPRMPTIRSKPVPYVVLMDEAITSKQWLADAVTFSRRSHGFTKVCPKCRATWLRSPGHACLGHSRSDHWQVALGEKKCPRCGYRFKRPNDRRDIHLDEE